MHQASLNGTHKPSARELEAALSRGVRTPMAALRAALEDLRQASDGREQSTRLVTGALRELTDLDRHLEMLLEYVAPAQLRPLRCSVAEILYAARGSLEADERTRVLIASEELESGFAVDGPQLVRVLMRLLCETLRDNQGDVLLRAREDGNELVFTIVEHAQPRPRPTASAWDDLEILLAKREVERMGGRTAVRDSLSSHRRLEVRMPIVGSER
ncbi:MAG: hypothetical protein GY711_04455 [bacterium]|nr:hypothetical protein [bacterium]